MSGDSDRPEIEREIVIVRRGGHGGEEGHHGGAWKIAYADFMTALMAFFLVMWLVNAANEETKAAVASYFNPIQLMDEKPADRSIQDEGQSSEGETNRPAIDTQGEGTTDSASAEQGSDRNATAGEETQYSESDYFENPYAVLAEIARETGQQANISDAGEGGAQTSGPASGASGGEAYRDPFDPDFWSQQSLGEINLDPTDQETALVTPQAISDDAALIEEALAPTATPADPAASEDVVIAPVAVPEPVQTQGPAEAAPSSETPPAEMAAASPAAETDTQSNAEAEELRTEIQQQIAGVGGKLAEGLEVTPAEGGLLISMTDQVDATMFASGSPVPQRELVLAMERIGALLAERDGQIVIRGHTDAHPFRGEGNDNWRLSTARAHSAYYMLVRGGLEEERIVQVSGFADRRPKLPDDPLADANRRIEILVQADASEILP
ncbi:MotB family protein [Rhizobium sp. EC-SD404]|uniref:MotB family protein n=1 Tax=Rhizobium sp. EC-SD404 TaxID=2038389 RepID=UPI0012565176|nr:MotB family protein [Rhizobium sp. EC-SD404]VVT32193.1 Flagellar motor protein [Rhizobium sp. EC-SD404]